MNYKIYSGFDKNADLLIKNGADVNLANKNGATPLDIAAFNGHVDFVELLLKNGANVRNIAFIVRISALHSN